jgi:hypothetical protein
MAQTMGAKIASTLHHRGEHEVGAITDPDGNHVYVPRAQWTQSHDHPLKANNAQWNQQHFVASELKRLHGEAKKKEYLKREADRQLQERSDNRGRMNNERKEFADLVNADAERFRQDQDRWKAESKKGHAILHAGLAEQEAEMGRRAHEARLREAQEQAEMKMRTVQQMCEEMSEQNRRKQQLQRDLRQGVADTEARKIQARIDKSADDDKARREVREALMRDEYLAQAKNNRVAEAQEQQDACVRMYDRTAGQVNRNRENAETLRLDNDEKKHIMRTDAFMGQRERARERQRQNMVHELDRQMDAINQKKGANRRAKEAERDAVQMATKRSLDQEMAKGQAKKAEELELQNELRVMMLEKEERERGAGGTTRPTALTTMNMSMHRNGNVCNSISDLHKSMEAGRYLEKPCGRVSGKPGEQRPAPLDASPGTIRKLAKNFKGEIPIGTVLGGVVGTLGGGGGGINCGLMATGGPYQGKPLSTGIAVQDRKLASHWHESLSPELLQAGRREASRREAAKREANQD